MRSDERAISASNAMFTRIMQLCNRLHAKENHGKPLVSGVVRVEIFLAAYMIVCHPSSTFTCMEQQERSLVDASSSFLECLEDVVAALQAGRAFSSVRRDLSGKLADYLRKFKVRLCSAAYASQMRAGIEMNTTLFAQDWKIADERRLAVRYRHALQGLQKVLTAQAIASICC